MKILVVSTNGILRDGITAWMVQYFSAMDKESLEVHSVAWDGTDPALISEVESAGIIVHAVPSRKRATRAYAAGLHALLGEGFDIIHVCGNSATMAIELWLAKRNVVDMRIAHVHNTVCSHRVADMLLRPAFYRCATDYYACGTDAGRWMYGRCPFKVIPNGKDPGEYAFSAIRRAEVRSSLGLADGQVAIGHVGSFNEQKNHAFLLRAFAAFRRTEPSSRLFLMGAGGKLEEIRALADELDLTGCVEFLGSRGDVPDLLQAMDCMVLPSLFEGFPNVVVEWQFSGLPCVISDAVTDECAITPLVSRVPLSAGPEAWARRIGEELGRPSRADDSASAARLLGAAGYDVHEGARALKELYVEGVRR